MKFSTLMLTSVIAARLVMVAASARGQNVPPTIGGPYRIYSIQEDYLSRAKRNQKQTIVRRVIRGDAALAENEQIFRDWHQYYIFPRFTRPEEFTNLANYRRELLKNLHSAESSDLHDLLVDLVFKAMTEMVQSDPEKGIFHPMVRYNAMLMLGDLNSKEAVLGGDAPKAPPALYADALPLMVREFTKADQIDAVRVAAMIGILRHVEIDRYLTAGAGVPAALKSDILKAMLAMMEAEKPPVGRSLAGHLWMQRRAMDLLGALGELGPDGSVAKALAAVIDDNKAPLSHRCTAVLAQEQLNLAQDKQFDPTLAARSLGLVAVAACGAEVEVLKKYLEELEGPGGGGNGVYRGSLGDDAEIGLNYRPSGMGPLGRPQAIYEDEMDPELDAVIRRLKHRLLCIQQGLIGAPPKHKGGLAAIAKEEPQKTLITGVNGRIEELLKAIDSKTIEARRLSIHIRNEKITLQKLLRSVAVPKKRPSGEVPASAAAEAAAAVEG